MYKHLFFDLDHTLWDYERCAAETWQELYVQFDLARLAPGISCQQFTDTYRTINRQLWAAFSRGDITKRELRHQRFARVFTALGLPESLMPAALPEAWQQASPCKPHLMPHAATMLQALHGRYALHVITNGFGASQRQKLQSAGVLPLFQQVITADNCGGFQKPHAAIFEYAMRTCDAQPRHCLMIGDNAETDVAGARAAGIDQVYYRPHRPADLHETPAETAQATYEISCLSELPGLLAGHVVEKERV